jgi:hypothetical protein
VKFLIPQALLAAARFSATVVVPFLPATQNGRDCSSLDFQRQLGRLAGILLVLAAMAGWLGRGPRPIGPAAGETNPFARGSFGEGKDAADDTDVPFGLATRGSYIDGDRFRGTYASGWFGSRPQVALMVAGFPRGPGNALGLEARLDGGAIRPLPYSGANPGECWRPWTVSLPPEANAFRIVAVDGSTTFRGWLAVSQPFRPDWRIAMTSQTTRSLLAFLVQGSLLAALALALIEFVGHRFNLTPWLAPIGAAAGVALLGYVAFWLYFASPLLGRIYSWSVLSWAVVRLARVRRAPAPTGRPAEWQGPFMLAVVIGLGAVALTCLFDAGSFSYLAGNRFLINMPPDLQIPRILADHLWSGQNPREVFGDWHSSDRPPLQAGWLLLTKPVVAALGFDADTTAQCGGICFQLLWIPALWALLRRLGARPRQAAAVIAALSFTGVFLLYTVFTWPKFGAASLLLAAFVAGLTPFAEPGTSQHPRLIFLGACAALAWLAHGAVAFSLIGLLPLVLVFWLRRRRAGRDWLVAVIAFGVLALPWLAYQKFYDPPGDRLLKWHLAGVIPPDGRGFGETLAESYRAIGWHRAWAIRRINLSYEWWGHWRELASLHPGNALYGCQWDQCSYFLYAFGWWLPALLILPWAVWRGSAAGDGMVGWTAAWWLSGWLSWIALMFMPETTLIHQGTLLSELLGFTLMAWCALRLHRVIFLACTALEVTWFLRSWVAASPIIDGAISPLAVAVSTAAGLVLAGIIVTGTFGPAPAFFGKSARKSPEH